VRRASSIKPAESIVCEAVLLACRQVIDWRCLAVAEPHWTMSATGCTRRVRVPVRIDMSTISVVSALTASRCAMRRPAHATKLSNVRVTLGVSSMSRRRHSLRDPRRTRATFPSAAAYLDRQALGRICSLFVILSPFQAVSLKRSRICHPSLEISHGASPSIVVRRPSRIAASYRRVTRHESRRSRP
jgi:hypothetical protein